MDKCLRVAGRWRGNLPAISILAFPLEQQLPFNLLWKCWMVVATAGIFGKFSPDSE